MKRFSAEYFSLVGRLPEETDVSFAKEKDPILFADSLAAAMLLDLEQKQQLIAEVDVLERLRLLLAIVHNEINVLKIEREISGKVAILGAKPHIILALITSVSDSATNFSRYSI